MMTLIKKAVESSQFTGHVGMYGSRDGNGGAIYAEGVMLTINNTGFNNCSGYYGGAIYATYLFSVSVKG